MREERWWVMKSIRSIGVFVLLCFATFGCVSVSGNRSDGVGSSDELDEPEYVLKIGEATDIVGTGTFWAHELTGHAIRVIVRNESTQEGVLLIKMMGGWTFVALCPTYTYKAQDGRQIKLRKCIWKDITLKSFYIGEVVFTERDLGASNGGGL